MATGNFPLLLFPEPTPADRNSLGGGGGSIRVPDIARQRARIAPQLTVLQQAFDAQRLKLQQTAPMENPELILVLEVAGTVEDFAKAVAKIPGMEWLVEWAEDQIAPDEDFFIQGKADKSLPGRLFLLASNQEALSQLLALWIRYQNDPAAQFDRGLNKFRNMFGQLRNIRHWSAADRIDTDVRQYWQNCLDDGLQAIRFEIEAWHFASHQKNDKAREDITALVQGLGGQVLRHALISEIAYHGFLVELPAQAVAGVLAGQTPDLVMSDRIMFFRPKAQSITDGVNEADVVPQAAAVVASDQPPIVALLDGLPLQNHAQLQGRLLVDDPDGWEGDYAAKDRVHGTAMASLILHGELDGGVEPLRHRLYVRPVLRPDPNDNFNTRRREHTPDDVLLIDLIHRAVKRICEGEGQEPAAAPSVRVINLSIGDEARLFDRQMSPWARLLDWLAFRYSVLFIVSAGNDLRTLSLQTPSHTLDGLTPEQRSALAFTAMTTEHVDRRLLAPAEALNVLTVGALHADQANAPAVPGRYDLFVAGGLSPLSRIGHPDAGLPRSCIGQRFDPDAEKKVDDIFAPIPLWKEPVSDIWVAITHGDKQNWASDLQPADWACGLWAKRAFYVRAKAAGDIQVLRDRQELDGLPPIVDATGLWIRDEPMLDRLNFIGELHPLLRPWFAATLGPRPDARRSYEVALEILHTPKAMFEVVSGLHHVLHACEEDDALMPLWRTLDATLLDTSITAKGTRRPWFANTGFQLELRTMPIDMSADLDDIERLWQTGLQIHHLLDAGERIGPSDFPAPWDVLTNAMENVFIEGTQEEGYAKVQALLQEAQEARQWSIPWGARVEVAFGPFIALKIFEREGEFSCHFLDDQDRYLLLPIGLQGQPPKIGEVGILRRRSDDGEYTWNHDAEIALRLIAAAIVRDFLVVEDRAPLFDVRPMRRRLQSGRNVRDIIYLPRVRYTSPNPERMTVDDGDATRARHQVSPHLRRAGTASTAQRFLAQRYGMDLPVGFTFVRPHERGTAAGEQRIKVYRSRSASRMIFEELAKAPEGTRPEWFEFEKDCARILQSQGMRVIHQAVNRSGDLGVDLYAVDTTGQSWVVQCKCWARHRPVGPDVVRELVGAIASSDRGMTTKSRGMIITTSSFTSGAASEATNNGFVLVDGIRLVKLLD